MSKQKVQRVIWKTIEFMERSSSADRMSVDLGGNDMVFYRGESHIIKLIGDEPDIINSEIARRIGVKRTVVFKSVKNLESRGIIRKNINEKNKRQVSLSLTHKGNEVYRKLIEYQKRKNKIFFSYLSDLSEDELDIVLQYLDYSIQTFDKLSE